MTLSTGKTGSLLADESMFASDITYAGRLSSRELKFQFQNVTASLLDVTLDNDSIATGTLQCTSVIATNTVTVNGLVYTAVNGVKSDNTEFSVDTGDNECAADLADSINNDVRTGVTNPEITNIVATVVTDTVTVSVTGGQGNSVDLAETGGTVTLSGALLTGGPTWYGMEDANNYTALGLHEVPLTIVKGDAVNFKLKTASVVNNSRIL